MDHHSIKSEKFNETDLKKTLEINSGNMEKSQAWMTTYQMPSSLLIISYPSSSFLFMLDYHEAINL